MPTRNSSRNSSFSEMFTRLRRNSPRARLSLTPRLEARFSPGCAVDSSRRLVASGHSSRYRGRPIHRQRRSDRCCGVGARPLRLRTSTRELPRDGKSRSRSRALGDSRDRLPGLPRRLSIRAASRRSSHSPARQTEVLIPRGWRKEGRGRVSARERSQSCIRGNEFPCIPERCSSTSSSFRSASRRSVLPSISRFPSNESTRSSVGSAA